MKGKHWQQIFMFIMLFAVAALIGCSGSDGKDGISGTNGTNGTNGKDLTTGTVDAGTFTFEDLKNIALGGKILSVDMSGDKPVVTFQVTNKGTGEGIRGLRTFSLHIAQLKPEANGSNSYWQNYITSGSSAAGPFRPTTDPVTNFKTDGTVNVQGYSVVDNNDGTYKVTFAANVKTLTTDNGTLYGTTRYKFGSAAYDPTLVHRVVVGVRSVAVPGVVGLTPGAYAGPINPLTNAAFGSFTNTNGANLIYDFTPSTGVALTTSARDIVKIDACNECHYKIQYGFPRGNNTSGHFGSRTDTKTCVMCHTPQNVDPANAATTLADFTPFIHKIHMGEELPVAETLLTGATEVAYPQDIRNCAKCHKGTDGDNWKSKPTRKACGSCHNNVNFATGANHIGGSKADDSICSVCHGAPDVAAYHVPVTTVTNATSGAKTYYANNGNLPTGAYKIEYVISSVSIDSARRPVVKFQIKKDGTPVVFGTYNAATNANLIPNTTGGPSIRFNFNVSQDGITSPADYNTNMSVTLGASNPSVSKTGVLTAPTAGLWQSGGTLVSSGITYTLTGPDSAGLYTVTDNTSLPASTTMLSAMVYGTFYQTNVTGYPYSATLADYNLVSGTTAAGTAAYAWQKPGVIISPAAQLKTYTGTGFTARRTIVDNAKCNACHDQLGIIPSFHSGARNDGTICNACHTQNGTNGGWSYSENTFIHAIHGPSIRTNNYTWASSSATAGFFNVGYPGLLKNCEQCHLTGTYDFTASASSAVVGKQLYNTVATGKYDGLAANAYTMSPYVVKDNVTSYGSGFSYTVSTGVTVPAAATTLVSSPISAACFSCHDNNDAKNHMIINGGSIYEARATALGKTETCLVCHGIANNAAFNETVPTIKAVHRWW